MILDPAPEVTRASEDTKMSRAKGLTYEELMKRAQELGSKWNTDWAEEHADEYDAFAEACEDAYAEGLIGAADFNELIITGLYDYDGEMKEDEE